MMGDPILLTVGDVKQYFYCPRIVYYNYLMPAFRPVTYKMEEGKMRQKEEERLEKRRMLSKFGIASGRDNASKLFNVRLLSHSLGLSGMLDMALLTDGEAIPVDFKDGAFSKGNAVALHHKYQLMAYGLLLEGSYSGKESRIGFIRSLEDGGIRSVVFSDGAKMFLKGKIRKMRRMILEEIFPEETPYKGRCRECEFRPVCKG